MHEHGIKPIDLVVVNLYPFEQTIARTDCNLATAIENIDIGGPTMLRAAAKNHRDVAVVVDAGDYEILLGELQESGGLLEADTRFRLAVKTFEHTARYDGAIANYLGSISDSGERVTFPHTFNVQFRKMQEMRYGENPHQGAASMSSTARANRASPPRANCRARNSLSITSPTPTPPWSA